MRFAIALLQLSLVLSANAFEPPAGSPDSNGSTPAASDTAAMAYEVEETIHPGPETVASGPETFEAGGTPFSDALIGIGEFLVKLFD